MVYKIFLRGKTGYIVNFPRGKAGYIVDFPWGKVYSIARDKEDPDNNLNCRYNRAPN